MKVYLMSCTKNPEETCRAAASICTGGKGSAAALRRALDSGHESVAEHASFTFCAYGVSRVTLAQVTRHRLASYSVRSQRYCDESGAGFVMPPSVAGAGLAGRYGEFMEAARRLYVDLQEAGVPAEDARYVLPHSAETAFVFTMDARELRHFFRLRLCNRAQWEIRELAGRMLRLCQEEAPSLFEGCGPACATPGGCREARPCGHPYAAGGDDA